MACRISRGTFLPYRQEMILMALALTRARIAPTKEQAGTLSISPPE
jgi:hypothetical protein